MWNAKQKSIQLAWQSTRRFLFHFISPWLFFSFFYSWCQFFEKDLWSPVIEALLISWWFIRHLFHLQFCPALRIIEYWTTSKKYDFPQKLPSLAPFSLAHSFQEIELPWNRRVKYCIEFCWWDEKACMLSTGNRWKRNHFSSHSCRFRQAIQTVGINVVGEIARWSVFYPLNFFWKLEYAS